MSSGTLRELGAQILRSLVRGVLAASDDSNEYYQRLQVRGLGGEVLSGVQHVQPYGLFANPEDGAQVLLFEVGGARDHVVGVSVSDERYRPKNVAKGDTGLHGKSYTAVRCKVDGTVEVEGGEGSVHITVDPLGNVTISGGTVSITGTSSVDIGAATTIDGKPFLAHTHPKPAGCAGGPATGGVS